jgi:hypothetical protein
MGKPDDWWEPHDTRMIRKFGSKERFLQVRQAHGLGEARVLDVLLCAYWQSIFCVQRVVMMMFVVNEIFDIKVLICKCLLVHFASCSAKRG